MVVNKRDHQIYGLRIEEVKIKLAQKFNYMSNVAADTENEIEKFC